jgi:hypothetical protein
MSSQLTPQNKIRNLLAYWRNSLADEEMMGWSSRGDDVLYVEPGMVSDTGEVPADLSSKLIEQWKTILERAKREPAVVPVVLLAKGLAPEHSHGIILGNRKTEVSFTIAIPAKLRDRVLVPDDEHRPWIGREFLEPMTDDDEELPVVGSVADYDEWLDHHPPDYLSWATLVEWCDGMWSAVSHGTVPKGFVEIGGMRIHAASVIQGAAQHLIKLYDVLLDESDWSPLFTRLCHGLPFEIDRANRLRQIDAARGAMGARYGMANSQAEAVVAMTQLSAGEVLAVHGPPGTGKTSLLQAVIANETVRRAIEGQAPAIIVGCSTNNQAVTNINRAMNDVLAENGTGDIFSWARRWVPDAETYGLYLPTSDRADEAIANGFRIAVRSGGEWTGFPEHETDRDYVAKAASLWMVAFKDYGISVAGIEAALPHIQNNLQVLLGEIQAVKAELERWEDVENWWQNRCHGMSPEQFIEQQKAAYHTRETTAVAALEDRIHETDAARSKWDIVVTDIRTQHDGAREKLTASSALFDSAARLKSRIEAAGVAQGVVELLGAVLPFLRSAAEIRQHDRRIHALGPEERAFFHDLLDVRDEVAWCDRAKQIVVAARQDLDFEVAPENWTGC